MRMSWIEILKYNDLEFCPRRSQRTCWGHSGSSRGRDCAYRRSSSLSPTILIFFILPILFLFLLLFFFHLCILLLLHFPSFSISFSSLFLSICFSCPPNSLLNFQCLQVLGEGNFGKVWKAEVDDICGYEGTILVAVKGVKASAVLSP